MSDPFDDLADVLVGAFGANPEQQAVSQWLSTGYLPLNHAISGRYADGGLPSGRMTEIFGPPSAGKTAIATEVMIAAQKAGGIAAFMDHERSFDVRLGEARGLNIHPGRWIYRKPRTFEDSVETLVTICHKLRTSKLLAPEAPIAWVFDSLACMIPQSQIEKATSKLGMADQTALARATSLNLRTMALYAEELNICVIFLNQTRTKPGVIYGDPTTTPGGNSPKFYASVRIQLGTTRLMKKEGDESVMLGAEITARCVKNKVYRPYMKAKWRFMFQEDGSGKFDSIGSLVDLLADRGVITKAGAYLVWDGKKYSPRPLLAVWKPRRARSTSSMTCWLVPASQPRRRSPPTELRLMPTP